MSERGAQGEGAAEALRRAFDRSFSLAPEQAERQGGEELLAIRAGGEPYAVRLGELSGLYRDRKVVPFCSPDPRFLGLISHRGGLVPVYDLRALLGLGAAAPPRWLALVRGPSPVGLSFDGFDGYMRAQAGQTSAPAGGHVEKIVAAGTTRPLLRLAPLIESISRPPGGSSPGGRGMSEHV